ncbi:hypothetical protein GF377_05375, partial [candidate division GN15 bacterium]|nr:hypothetical protein [candidate division GN15 bacterium]
MSAATRERVLSIPAMLAIALIITIAVGLATTTHATGLIYQLSVPGGFARFRAEAVSSDGSAVVGTAYDEAGDVGEAFIWRLNTGWQGIGSLVTNEDIDYAIATDINGDGTVACGYLLVPGETPGNLHTAPFRWIQPLDGSEGTLEVLTNIPNVDTIGAYASAISTDGSTIVGSYYRRIELCPDDPSTITPHPAVTYRIKDGVFTPLGLLPGGECAALWFGGSYPEGDATCVSADGEVVGAYQGTYYQDEFDDPSPNTRSFLWDGSLNVLPGIGPDTLPSYVRDISDDGVSAVGASAYEVSQGSYSYKLVRWIGGTVQDMEYPFDETSGWLRYLCISGNGEFIANDSALWDADNGWRTLADDAVELGVEDNLDKLAGIIDLSFDGSVVLTRTNISPYDYSLFIRDACPDFDSGENVSEWQTAVDGQFDDESKWFQSPVPGIRQHALFAFPGEYTVTLDRMHAVGGMSHSAGEPVFDLAGHTLEIGAGADCGPALQSGDDDSLIIGLTFKNGDLTVNGDVEVIGGNTSYFNFDDTTIANVFGSFTVNGPPSQTVGIGDASQLSVSERLTLGENTNKRGELLLTGSGSQLSAPVVLVGNAGEGRLTAESSSLVLT